VIAISNSMYINLGLQINDKAEKICILGNTIGFFGAVLNNKLSLSDSNPDTISNNLCWLINECRKNSEIMIIGNADTYKYYKSIFKWVGDSLQKRINWSSVNINKIIKNLSDFEEFEDNVDKSYIKVLEELYNKKLKFTKIIMNPPYDGNFHLKLVSTAMRLSDDIINLSPIRWLQDPLAEYKKSSDWNKFEDVRKNIESIDIITAHQASDIFVINLKMDLGIYHITKNGKWESPYKNKLLEKIVSKTDGFPIVKYENVEKPCFCLISSIVGDHSGFDNLFKDCSILKNEQTYGRWFVNGKSEKNGLSLAECKAQNKRSVHGDILSWDCVEFDTEEETKNFYDVCYSKLFMYVLRKSIVDVNIHPRFLPFISDYTHPWTDEMLYDFFGLTPEERDEINKEIAC